MVQNLNISMITSQFQIFLFHTFYSFYNMNSTMAVFRIHLAGFVVLIH